MLVSVTIELQHLGAGNCSGCTLPHPHIYQFLVHVEGRTAIVGAWCDACLYAKHHGFLAEPTGGRPTNKKRLRRAATKQENEIERMGGRRQSGSGARPGYKGDGRVDGRYRLENKFTQAASLRVKLSDLTKLRGECEGLEVPVFAIQFKEKGTLRTLDDWVLIPRKEFERLANEADNDS